MSDEIKNRSELPADLATRFRADAIRRGYGPEEFWSRQRMGIRARIADAGEQRPRGLWWSMATAAVIFLAVLSITPSRPRPQTAPPAVLDADQELLLAVERSLSAGTPEALEPLTLLVESSTNDKETESISHKEHGHEN